MALLRSLGDKKGRAGYKHLGPSGAKPSQHSAALHISNPPVRLSLGSDYRFLSHVSILLKNRLVRSICKFLKHITVAYHMILTGLPLR
jgi:hypothetical protein